MPNLFANLEGQLDTGTILRSGGFTRLATEIDRRQLSREVSERVSGNSPEIRQASIVEKVRAMREEINSKRGISFGPRYEKRIKSNICLVDSTLSHPSGQDKIWLDTVPQLNEDWDGDIKRIKSPGRNNSFLHYLNGDEVINITFDWFANDRHDDPFVRANWLKMMAINDGYKKRIRPLAIFWESTDNTSPYNASLGSIFKSSLFLVEKIKTRSNLFHGSQAMLPQQIFQDVTLIRVTKNNTRWSEYDYNKSRWSEYDYSNL